MLARVTHLSLYLFLISFITQCKADGNVHVLGDKNFTDFINSHAVTFVKFYAPWCGHCKNLAPTWSKLADELQGDKSIAVAKIDCSSGEGRLTASRFDIKGFPTLKVLTPDAVYDYKGKRDFSLLKEFITGGYKNASSDKLPGNFSYFDWVQKLFVEFFMRVFKVVRSDSIVAAFFIILGFLFKVLIDCLTPDIEAMKRKMDEEKKAAILADRLRNGNQNEETPVKNPDAKKGD